MLGFGAVNTGNNLLYLMVSALLGFMALSGLLGKTNLDRLTAVLVPPEEVFAQSPARLQVRLTNGRRLLPGFLLEAEFNATSTLFPLVPVRGEASAVIPCRFDRRGSHPFPDLWIHSRYPINFFIRSIRIPVSGEVVVFPTPLAGELPVAEGDLQPGDRDVHASSGQDGEIRSIGDYLGTEPLRSIHWKLSARHESLKVKQHAAIGSQPITIDLDSLPGGVEERLSRACFQVLELTRGGRPVGLQAGRVHITPDSGPAHRQRLLRELALYAVD